MSIDAAELKRNSQVWWGRLLNRRTQFAMDILVLTAAFCVAYALRFDFDIPDANARQGLRQLPYVLAFLPILAMRLAIPNQYHQWRVPFSIIFINSLLAFGGVVGLRVLRRAVYEQYEQT
jgi:hypothetical protein